MGHAHMLVISCAVRQANHHVVGRRDVVHTTSKGGGVGARK